MEKPASSCDGSRELQCVGRLEIAKPKPVGFLCGSIPVPTDKAFYDFNSALIPSNERVRAPRYRMLPTETNLNMPPLLSNIPEKVLPIRAAQSKAGGDLPLESGAITSNLIRKGEALAVSGLVEYGDEIDVIAPADILKQIFKIPYSKARLSIAVHRIGQTLVLNAGPDVEEGEKLVRRHGNQSNGADQSLFLNFAMHSVRMEACDCPPTYRAPSEEQSESSVLPGQFKSSDGSFESSDHPVQVHTSEFFERSDDIAQEEGFKPHSEYPQAKRDNIFWGSKKNKRSKNRAAVKNASQVKEKPRRIMQDSEKYRGVGSDAFLRVLFWKFHNFRMLLGSDLLLFSNEKYVAVSLHLWDVSRQVTPLTWLEAWLDNVMASVPELAICYHQDGVVQGYELLKTDDIFLLKGISEDGAPAFHPHVVQQNGHSVLRFLQENCKQDPGAYWLYKSAGEDVIQLFDLSVIPKNHASNECDDSSTSLPSLIHRGRSDSLLSLGTLLYRIGHKLSLSMFPHNRARCARFLKQCFDFLDEPDHLVVRAFAHEQFARLLLNYDEELDLTSETLPVETETGTGHSKDGVTSQEDSRAEVSATVSASRALVASDEADVGYQGNMPTSDDEYSKVNDMSASTGRITQTVADPISSKLAAVHHVSQAIKSLRWRRQLQSTDPELDKVSRTKDRPPSSVDFSVCACGDTDCIEVCDIREWLPTSKLDDKLWKLVLLLGESYLALGQAYKDNGQLHQAFKVVELACLVYGSMPQHLEDTKFVSSMVYDLSSQMEISGRCDKTKSFGDDARKESSVSSDSLTFEQFSSMYLFWAKAWTLVGDVYVEFHMVKGKELAIHAEGKLFTRELRMSSEVIKEVKRLKKKLGQFNQNCSTCSLVNCSCQSDRANSGSSASSSTGDSRPLGYGRKQSKRSNVKSSSSSILRNCDEDVHQKVENVRSSENVDLNHNKSRDILKETSNMVTNAPGEETIAVNVSKRVEGTIEMHNVVSNVAAQSDYAATETTKAKNGGIFKYLGDPLVEDAEYNLEAAISCYEEAIKALGGHLSSSAELHSVIKKKGWVFNELGRKRLERKELEKAELAFANAVKSFEEVSDHTNIILINCNLGHGRRALAEEMVKKIESLRKHTVFSNAYNQALDCAKLEYGESLRYYGAAKNELSAVAEESDSVSNSLRTEVLTQFAHTYLRLGMLLAREDTILEAYESGTLGKFSNSGSRRAKKELTKNEISANDAIRAALSVYESLGDLRKQESSYAYFQLACYQRDCCLKFLELDQKKSNLSNDENSILQRIKQYASLAERNWQKAMDFYGPKTHPAMYLTILIERSALSLSISSSFHTNAMLESALSRLLEGHHVSEKAVLDSVRKNNPEVYTKFWSQLQMSLKKMLATALSSSTNKSPPISLQAQCNRSVDVVKLKQLYRMSLNSTDFGELDAMHQLWTS